MFKFLKELLVPPTIEGKTFTEEEKDLIDKLVNKISKISKKKFTIKKFIQDEKSTYGRYRSSKDSINGIYKERFYRNEVTEIIEYNLILDKFRFDLRFDRIHSDNKDTELEYGLDVIEYPIPAKPWVFINFTSIEYSNMPPEDSHNPQNKTQVMIFVGNDNGWKVKLEDEISSVLKEINKRVISYLK